MLIAAIASALLAVGGTAPRSKDSTNPHAVQPERPTVATHAGTVARDGSRSRRASSAIVSTGSNRSSTPTVLKFGLASHAQLGVFGSAPAARRSARDSAMRASA